MHKILFSKRFEKSFSNFLTNIIYECVFIHYIIYTCKLKERITVFLERVKDRKKWMQGAWHGRRDEGWVDVFRCSGWNVKAGILGEAQLVMSDSLRFMSLESSSHTAYSSNYIFFFWTLSWYLKNAGSINACWNNLDHKKHTAHTQ